MYLTQYMRFYCYNIMINNYTKKNQCQQFVIFQITKRNKININILYIYITLLNIVLRIILPCNMSKFDYYGF